ncbi:MAG: Clp protease ClpP [Clostridia bacterium]|nr:Clp protease ClpP [Clostridia bacterium]
MRNKMLKALCKAVKTKNTLDIYIYDDICATKFDWSTWEDVESETGAKYIADLIASAGDVERIHVHINSYGGYIDQGIAIYTQLVNSTVPVTVHIDGVACSAASLVAMAGDTIIMGKCSLMMIHNPWTYASGNSTELRKAADDLDVMAKAMRVAYL